MNLRWICISWAFLFVIVIAAVGCAPRPTVTEASTFTDPFEYCASVVTIDAPDAHYRGSRVPDTIINGFKKAAGLEASTEPMDMLRQTTIWRCMGGKVYACNFGANLPCDSKANTDRTPTQAMNDFCAANANADFLPRSVTGHNTIYSWHCAGSTPEVLQQVGDVDAAGYLQDIWYEVQPGP